MNKLTETGTPKEKLKEFYDWTKYNYEQGSNPFVIYLDLIGYTKEYWGDTSQNTFDCLGYLELTMLSNCLALFENNGYETIYNIINEITQEEE